MSESVKSSSPVNQSDNDSTIAVVGTIEETTVVVEDVIAEVTEDTEKKVEELVESAKDAVQDAVNDVIGEVTNNEVVETLLEATAEQVIDEAFQHLVDQVNGKLGDLDINPQTVMTVVRFAMEVVEASELKGEEQKAMVLRLLEHVIRVAPISDEREKLCLDMLSEGVVANTIDIIIDASRGKLDVNTVAENAIEVAASTGCCGLLRGFTIQRKKE